MPASDSQRLWSLAGCYQRRRLAAQPLTNQVKVVEGVVLPKRPMVDAIAEAMQFLKKADGGYVPGKIDGELAGYFTSALVNPDGTRSGGQLPTRRASMPTLFSRSCITAIIPASANGWCARGTWPIWGLAHLTPTNSRYSKAPDSTFRDGKPGGGPDQDAIEPDKAAFFGAPASPCMTRRRRKSISTRRGPSPERSPRAKIQMAAGLFGVVPEDGNVRQEFGGAPVFFVQFFEDMLRYDAKPDYRVVRERALKLMLERHVEKNLWGTYHEAHIRLRAEGYLSAEPMSFTADYLFRHAKAHPEYIGMGRKVLRNLEARLVYTEGHPAAPAPAFPNRPVSSISCPATPRAIAWPWRTSTRPRAMRT